jgi:predicted NBD/HSP70 family sugar kinase
VGAGFGSARHRWTAVWVPGAYAGPIFKPVVVIPAKMGWINKRTLLRRLQRLGVASRADLARSLGMSYPTAGKIADELLELGVLEEVSDEDEPGPRDGARRPARMGRPGRRLQLNRSKARFLGIQLGVSETSLSPLPIGIDREDHWAMEVDTPDSAEDWVRELRRAASELPARDFWGVLVSVPGIVDERAGRVLFSPNLHWTERVELAGLIQQVWTAPVILVQEERALALGHQYLDPQSEDFLLVDFGDGVGGAAVLGGKLHESPLPLSGELGHTPVVGGRRRCGCGAVGCVETLVSTRGLLQSFGEQPGRSSGSWAALGAALQRSGVEPWLAETLDATASVIAGALNVLGLRHVVISGSLTELPSAVMDHLSNAVVKGAMWARFGDVKVEAVPRRRTAGLVAVGLDRVVLPSAGVVRVNSAPAPATSQAA